MDQRDLYAARVKGCLLGGAVGDALGAPVEFASLSEIRKRFGPKGLTDYVEAYGRLGAITDDTQMTLFSAEGLLRAYVRGATRGICSVPAVVHHAYVRWLLTQGVQPKAKVASGAGGAWPDGALIRESALWSRRAPGTTCLSALAATVDLGDRAQNNSKGCGALMRAAPVGLVVDAGNESGWPAFDLGIETASLTHGNPSGYLAAGYFAELIGQLLAGKSLRDSIDIARTPLELNHYADEIMLAIDRALGLPADGREPTPEKVESLGGGWVAEEALAIAIYCALVAESFEHGIRLGVNHGGDSDSTGSLIGQILATAGGVEVIPARWLAALELRDVIERIAGDLVAVRTETLDAESEEVWSRFPGW